MAVAFCLGLAAFTEPCEAQARGSLIVSNDICFLVICGGPDVPPPKVVQSGALLPIYVVALNPDGTRNETYAGTVTFSSSDPLASLPPPSAFSQGDDGHKGFNSILRSLGSQTISVSDPISGLSPGTLTMTVTGPAAASIPGLSIPGKVLLALSLAAAGFWLTRMRR
jgi:hypothetical protein